MALTPHRWWIAVPDEQRPAWRSAALRGVLADELAAALDAAGFVLPRHGAVAFLPPQLAAEILAP
jgi:hypothetical protein